MSHDKFEISVANIDLKPKNVTFLAERLWSHYKPAVKAVHEKVVAFMSDYNKHPFIGIGYKTDTTIGESMHEDFNMLIGSLQAVSVTVFQNVDHVIVGHDVANRAEVLTQFDEFAKNFHRVMYVSDDKELVANSLLHNVRALLGNVLAVNPENIFKVCHTKSANSASFELTIVVGDPKDAIHVMIDSPSIDQAN